MEKKIRFLLSNFRKCKPLAQRPLKVKSIPGILPTSTSNKQISALQNSKKRISKNERHLPIKAVYQQAMDISLKLQDYDFIITYVQSSKLHVTSNTVTKVGQQQNKTL